MAYELSFSDAFFYGNGEHDYYEMPPSERPTSVHQALVSMDDDTRRVVAKEVLGIEDDAIEYAIHAETFEADLMEKIREVNTCDDLSSPINVYLDNDGNHTVTVYEEGEEDND